MKGILRICITVLLLCAVSFQAASAENGEASSIRDMVMTENKGFTFRNGVTWGMTPEEAAAAEDSAMNRQTSFDWTVMITAEPVKVSRFSADLVYIFYQDALRMITYEFQQDCSSLNFQYLTGALCSLYGEKKEADPAAIKSWMDRVYQNYYNRDLIRQAMEWTAEDGTHIYLYWFSEQKYAILYVCPVSGGGSYDTNGL